MADLTKKHSDMTQGSSFNSYKDLSAEMSRQHSFVKLTDIKDCPSAISQDHYSSSSHSTKSPELENYIFKKVKSSGFPLSNSPQTIRSDPEEIMDMSIHNKPKPESSPLNLHTDQQLPTNPTIKSEPQMSEIPKACEEIPLDLIKKSFNCEELESLSTTPVPSNSGHLTPNNIIPAGIMAAQDCGDSKIEPASEDPDADDDEEEDGDEEDEDTEGGMRLLDHLTARQRAHHAITGRGVTLAMLMADKIIQPGESTMSIDYLGQKFTADLLDDGSIRWKEANKLFNSPSAWAIHCKKIVNPMKKSGCGWASVRYKGRKLDAYKSSWLRKKRPLAMASIAGGTGGTEDEGSESDGRPYSKKIKSEEELSEVGTDSGHQMTHQPVNIAVKAEKKRISVKHSSLGRKCMQHDPSTLVESTPFAALGKIQAFSLSISNTCLLSVDFHSHLSTKEVVGYLGGKWDSQTQHLSIERSFACCCRPGDPNNAPAVEREIRGEMEKLGLTLAGWYHSHPHSQADPSLRDLEAQLEYQIAMKGPEESIPPCVMLINSPYAQEVTGKKESDVRVVWLMAPPEHRPLDYGMPMRICYDVTDEPNLPNYILRDMKKQLNFYQNEAEFVNFQDTWHHSGTYLDKLKFSLSRKLLQDQQMDKQLAEFLQSLTT